MGKSLITGITALVLLTTLMLIGITVASVLTGETTGATTEEDYDQLVDETMDEISTYIMIKDQKGKFSGPIGQKKIDKIALWITPLFTQVIDTSQLTIQIDNGKTVRFLSYGQSEDLASSSLFDHPIWNQMNISNFSFISIVDLDNSLVEFDTLNDCSDNAYLVFQLPEDMALAKYDKIKVTLFPSTGITRIIELKAPMPMKSVITFE